MSKMDDYIIDELNELNEEQEGKSDRVKQFIGDIPEQVILDFPIEKVEEVGIDPKWADLLDPGNDEEFIKKKTPKSRQKGYAANYMRERKLKQIRTEFEAIRES